MTRRPTMPALIAAASLVLTACGEPTPATTPATTSPRATTTTPSTTPSRTPGALADKWDATFDTIKPQEPQSCSPATVRSAACANWLIDITTAASALDKELRARPDATRYTKTLVEVQKVLDASQQYTTTRCRSGGNTVERCHAEALSIGLGIITVGLRLRADDLAS